MRSRWDEHGVSLIELLLVLSIGSLVTMGAIGGWMNAREHARGAGAARALALRIAAVRLDALRRGAAAGLQFREEAGDIVLQMVLDENGNGLRADEVAADIDRRAGPPFRLSDDFPGVRFAVAHALPPIDGEGEPIAPGDDPVQIGRSSFLTFAGSGAGSSGTLYLVGPGARQLAVRVFGPTGRVRVFQYVPATERWITP